MMSLLPLFILLLEKMISVAKPKLLLAPASSVIAIGYVIDLIFWKLNQNHIVELAIQLYAEGVDLEQEHDAA
ncbi:hypothetical protein ACHAXS_002448 [Conticribra weissflogii]